MKKIIAFIILFICFNMQSQEKEVLKVYSFQEVEKLHQQNPKPIFIFIYTDWCKYCFAMKKNTFKNKEVIKALNAKFYFVKLNAEDKKDITFLNRTFKYKPTGNNTGIHELVLELTSKKENMSYPISVILNAKYEINIQIDNFINSKEILTLLNRI